MSKGFEKVMHEQLEYLNNCLNNLLRGFEKTPSTQHALD